MLVIAKLQQLQEASKVVEVTVNQLLFCILVIGSSVHCAKKHDGPPLYIRDIYTNGQPDGGRPQLLQNIQKAFPVLTLYEIADCIEFCKSDKNPDTDIIAECQELSLWKLAQFGTLKECKSCFEQYKKQR